MYAPYIKKNHSIFINQKIANLSWERDSILSYLMRYEMEDVREKKIKL